MKTLSVSRFRLVGRACLIYPALILGMIGVARAGEVPFSMPELGVSRGIGVILGDTTGAAALKVARETELILYLQFPRSEDVARVRQASAEAGLYGTRIYVERGPLETLYLADNVADVLVALSEASAVPEAEALRVVHPEAKVYLGRRLRVKAWPAGVDDWSHAYHGPDNNPASRDDVARGPYLTQFLSDPRYAPLPQVAVASAGRVFKAFGHIAFKKREEPWLNTLAAFNGFNGTLLWKREISPALMVHRNTLIATPTTVYFGDDKACQVIDAATGELRDQIVPPAEIAGGTFWKWMALEDGILYALIGEQEERDPVIRGKREHHGWPWDPLSPGYNKPEHTWGYGRTLVAINPQTKKVLWRHRETDAIDSRALCMKNGRLYAFRFGEYLTCLDAQTGEEVWRRTRLQDPELFSALGEYSPRQDWRTNWRTTSYLKCSDQALYFAGPTVNKLLAVSARDGSLLWEHPYNNYQLVLRPDGLYGFSGQIDKDPSRKFDPLTGEVLEEFESGRRACTRVTGSIDALFCRANGGSTRLDIETATPQLVSPMRPNCHDGVTISHGLLYWWPSTCDCNLTLYGITCLGPAGDFQFDREAVEAERLETLALSGQTVAALPLTAADWPVFRANAEGTVTTAAAVPTQTQLLWSHVPAAPYRPTAPVAAGNLVLFGGSDGMVRAINALSGQEQWKAFTGGDLRYPPTLWEGRALVGSGDGWVYCFEAATGRPLWRFRAAPVERRIPVYGGLQSTWPAASGVLVHQGTAYVAAGIVNYDGTHVYALDAATGRIRWQNNASGHLDADAHSGVSVQGQMMVMGDRLFLCGGNAVSPALYDLRDGRCLNDPEAMDRKVNNNVIGSFSPRGSELYRLGNQIFISGKPHYAHPQYPVYDDSVQVRTLLAVSGPRTVAWINGALLQGLGGDPAELAGKFAAAWGQPRKVGVDPVWQEACPGSTALAVGHNALVVAEPNVLTARSLEDGKALWSQNLPVPTVPWGLIMTRGGRAIAALENGEVRCFGAAGQMAAAR